jgi:diadenosine tetraphosphate (Ap4A) HIT family hydrolase
VAESAEDLYRRWQEALGPGCRPEMPPVEDWVTFPYEGDIRVRALLPPAAEEPPRKGEDAADCWRCTAGAEDAIWSDERWLLAPLPKPSGLPVVVILFPRAHHDLCDLPDELATELGPLLVRVAGAVASVGEIGRVHVCRWGDGSAHFHVWFMARPARVPQVRGTFAALWDDILPPLPEDVWRENLEAVGAALRA